MQTRVRPQPSCSETPGRRRRSPQPAPANGFNRRQGARGAAAARQRYSSLSNLPAQNSLRNRPARLRATATPPPVGSDATGSWAAGGEGAWSGWFRGACHPGAALGTWAAGEEAAAGQGAASEGKVPPASRRRRQQRPGATRAGGAARSAWARRLGVPACGVQSGWRPARLSARPPRARHPGASAPSGRACECALSPAARPARVPPRSVPLHAVFGEVPETAELPAWLGLPVLHQ